MGRLTNSSSHIRTPVYNLGIQMGRGLSDKQSWMLALAYGPGEECWCASLHTLVTNSAEIAW